MELYGSERAYKEMLEGKTRYADKRNRREEEEEEKTADMAAKFNSDIISYLHGVDMEHGTHYCPTGIAGDKNPNL